MRVFFIFLFTVGIGFLYFQFHSAGKAKAKCKSTKVSAKTRRYFCELGDSERLAQQKFILDSARKLKPWLQRNGYRTDYVLMANFRIPIYYKRFFLIDLKKDTIAKQSLVAHGKGMGSSGCKPVYCNKSGSLCSSFGRYRLGDSLWGEFGKGFYMHGLDTSNSNAVKRLIVLHYYDMAPCEEGESVYFSEGCPMLCKKDFYFYDAIIQKTKRPMLLVIVK